MDFLRRLAIPFLLYDICQKHCVCRSSIKIFFNTAKFTYRNIILITVEKVATINTFYAVVFFITFNGYGKGILLMLVKTSSDCIMFC